jgi:hypothetical protein
MRDSCSYSLNRKDKICSLALNVMKAIIYLKKPLMIKMFADDDQSKRDGITFFHFIFSISQRNEIE